LIIDTLKFIAEKDHILGSLHIGQKWKKEKEATL
jgi:hypothetical protein